MLDPGLEHMHRHGREWRATTRQRQLVTETVADLVLLVPVILLLAFAPKTGWAQPWEVVLLIGACAVTSLVRFEVGSGSMSPLELMVVPMWFAVPPAWLPVVFGLSLALAGVYEHWRDGDPLLRGVFNAGDAWPAVGPAIVFAVAGAPEANIENVWLVVAALAAQLSIDFAVGTVTPWWFHGIRPRLALPVVAWAAIVDAALVPIGFVVAVVSTDYPLAVLALLPLIGLIGEFARERRERLDQALQLSTTYRGTAQLMGDVLEADDAYTGGEHTQGVVEMAVAVGLELKLEPREMRDLEFGALLHDIGKLRVPNEIINKPGSLTSEEWDIVRRHPVFGQQMLDRVGGAMTEAGRIVRAHHERWDGAGYPDGLAGEDIPRAARIITVCDSFSAMTTDRSYSAARSHDDALVELQRCSGAQFDPVVVDALYRVLERSPELSRTRQRPGFKETPAAAAALGLRPIA